MYRLIVDLLSNLSGAPRDSRTVDRVAEPRIAAYYWDGSAPSARRLRDISLTGVFVYTDTRWYPGTIVRVLLQELPRPGGAAEASISVSLRARVVWNGADGMALEFLPGTSEDRKLLERLIAATPAAIAARPASIPAPPAATSS